MKKPLLTFQLLFFLFFVLCQSSMAQASLLQVVAEADSLRCHGDDNGELFWQISGGTAPYNYEWQRLNNGFVFAAGEQSADDLAGPVGGNLEANIYVITIVDAAGNEARDTVEIGEPDRILVTDISLDNSRCSDSCDGSIQMAISGGTGELITQWNDGPELGPIREGLCAGEYVFFIVDERACRQKGSIGISAPPAIEIEVVATEPSCAGVANGTLMAAATGGTGELNFAWSTGDPGPDISTIGDGAYELTVTDDSACEAVTIIDLPDGPPLQANVQVNYGCGDGQLIVSAQPINGTAPYTYDWSTGSSSPWLVQMSSGTYSLSLVDANGCTDNVTFELDFIPTLTVEETVQDVSCPGSADGAVSLDVEGGLPPYAVRWNNNQTDLELFALSGGAYDYNISAGGCALAGVVFVEEPSPWELELVFMPQSNELLTATAFVSGGNFPYQFQWSNGSTGLSANDLNPDQVYSLVVTDANGCEREWEVRPSLTSTNGNYGDSPFLVFPNPSSGIFSLQSPPSGTKERYMVYDASGKALLPFGNSGIAPLQIDLSAYPSGTYYLRRLDNLAPVVIPLVKQ